MFVRLAALLLFAAPAFATPRLGAVLTVDPPRDAAHPARMAVIHVPVGGVAINGIAYLASGIGPHPTLIIAHGWPGNEKNLDLAQAVRRAGWNAVTFNYRGSWGSAGKFRFAQVPEDAAAVLAYLRGHAAELGVDPRRLVLAGHSMGGWATALTAARDAGLAGAILISASDLGKVGTLARPEVVAGAAGNSETLVTTPEIMADELIAGSAGFAMTRAAPGLRAMPLLVLTSDDGLAPHSDALVAAVRTTGGSAVTTRHVATDHGWSDARLRLAGEVIDWLDRLPAR